MSQKISIIGSGLVGTLLAIGSKKKNYEVEIFEKRPKISLGSQSMPSKSINLALSERGLKALSYVGLDKKVLSRALPMYGRYVHTINQEVDFQPYTLNKTDAIYSVSREELNKLLQAEAEKLKIPVYYNYTCTKIDFEKNIVGFRNAQNEYVKITPEICMGTDGAYSELRNEMIQHEGMNYSQEYLEYGYKEIHMPPNAQETWALPPDGLHIWPKKDYMLIALPNLDKSFTCTLFYPVQGFRLLNTESLIIDFFHSNFPEIEVLIPNVSKQFLANPVGRLVTVKCFPYLKANNHSLYYLMGDAAHAIVPFYGQGMNCGFEDVRILLELIEENNTLDANTLEKHQQLRKPQCDAIAEMALINFVEMRDWVTDPEFKFYKNLENQIQSILPHVWQSAYELVSFSNVPYSYAQKVGILNKEILKHIKNQNIKISTDNANTLEKIIRSYYQKIS